MFTTDLVNLYNRNIFKTSLYIYIFQDEKCRLMRKLSLSIVSPLFNCLDHHLFILYCVLLKLKLKEINVLKTFWKHCLKAWKLLEISWQYLTSSSLLKIWCNQPSWLLFLKITLQCVRNRKVIHIKLIKYVLIFVLYMSEYYFKLCMYLYRCKNYSEPSLYVLFNIKLCTVVSVYLCKCKWILQHAIMLQLLHFSASSATTKKYQDFFFDKIKFSNI